MYTVNVFSLTKLPAKSHIFSKILFLDTVFPLFIKSNNNILYSSAVKMTSFSLIYTLLASKSIITLCFPYTCQVDGISVLCIPRTACRDTVNNHVGATYRMNVKPGRILECHTLYQNILTVSDAYKVCAQLLCFFSRVRYFWQSVVQLIGIPELSVTCYCSAHRLKFVPFGIADFRMFYRSPVFSVAVYCAFTCNTYILAFADVDHRHTSV